MPNNKNRKAKIDMMVDQIRFLNFKQKDDDEANEKALAEYFEIHEHGVYQFVFELCPDIEDAENAVAQAFAVLWEKRHGLKNLKQLENCLYTAAGTEAVAIMNRKGRILLLGKKIAELFGQLPDSLELQKILAKIEALLVEENLAKSPKRRLNAFLRQYSKMLSDKGLSKLNGIGSETAYALCQGAMHRLRLAIRDDRFEAIAACLVLLLTTQSWLNFFN